MALRITTICENTAGTLGVLGEWGLSVLVESDDRKVLLDSGGGMSFANNIDRLTLVYGIDLLGVDRIVLSHGHTDHTGGLMDALARTGPVEVIAHPDIWADKYAARSPGMEPFLIKMPFAREELEAMGATFNLTRDPVWITDSIVTTGEIPMVTEYEQIDANLLVREGDSFAPDPLFDDRALIIKTDEGLVVILGCAHRGVINTLHHAREITGVELVNTVIGGTHLIGATEERIMLTVAALQEFGVQRLGVSHCTGLPASVRLAQELGDIFFFNNAGTRITIP